MKHIKKIICLITILLLLMSNFIPSSIAASGVPEYYPSGTSQKNNLKSLDTCIPEFFGINWRSNIYEVASILRDKRVEFEATDEGEGEYWLWAVNYVDEEKRVTLAVLNGLRLVHYSCSFTDPDYDYRWKDDPNLENTELDHASLDFNENIKTVVSKYENRYGKATRDGDWYKWNTEKCEIWIEYEPEYTWTEVTYFFDRWA